jgi:Zn-dependent M16 (insulinase) family peptidase
MKGYLADPNYNFMLAIQKNLFPGTTYAKDSGGDPRIIPELTH